MKNWNLMFIAGNPLIFSKIRSYPGNPLKRSDALARATKLAKNGWRVWVEHKETKELIFDGGK